MIARVVPLLRLPRAIGVFDYTVDESLPRPGTLVSVPFRKRSVPAVVLETTTTSHVPSSRLFRITREITNEPLIDRTRLQLMLTIARETYNSPATVFRSFLPNFPTTKTYTLPKLTSDTVKDSAVRSTIDAIVGSTEEASIITYHSSEKKHSYIESVRHATSDAGFSTLIITPSIVQTRSLVGHVRTSIPYLHDEPIVARRNLFLGIRSEQVSCVIGTRSALMAPLANLGLIIIDDEDSDGHVQDAPNPRFDARRIARILARITDSRIIFLSRLPSLITASSYQVVKQIDGAGTFSRQFVDLDASRAAGDFHILSESSMKLTTETTARKENVLVVHARRTDYGSIECLECGTVVTCPACNVPIPQEGLRLVCKHCATIRDIPARCSRCGSVNLKGRGRGIPHLSNELIQSGLQVNVIDATDAPASKPGEVDIISMAQTTSLTDDHKYHVIIVTRFDSAFSVPRYDAEERARRLLITLESHLKADGTMIVQSSASYQRIIKNPYDDSWRDRAINDTDRFGYPPTWKLIMLRIRKSSVSDTPPAQLYRTLQRLSADVTVTPPQPSIGKSHSDRGGTMILVRFRKKIPSELDRILSHLGEQWTITINPRELR